MLSGEASTGVALANAIKAAVASTSRTNGQLSWFITDQNGEYYRAAEWGQAIVRLKALDPAFDAAEVWYPASSFGDTASASGAVGICIATCAFERGYARAGQTLIVSSGDGRERAALVFTSGG